MTQSAFHTIFKSIFTVILLSGMLALSGNVTAQEADEKSKKEKTEKVEKEKKEKEAKDKKEKEEKADKPEKAPKEEKETKEKAEKEKKDKSDKNADADDKGKKEKEKEVVNPYIKNDAEAKKARKELNDWRSKDKDLDVMLNNVKQYLERHSYYSFIMLCSKENRRHQEALGVENYQYIVELLHLTPLASDKPGYMVQINETMRLIDEVDFTGLTIINTEEEKGYLVRGWVAYSNDKFAKIRFRVIGEGMKLVLMGPLG